MTAKKAAEADAAARSDAAPEKKSAKKQRNAPKTALTQDDVIRDYRAVYDRCMEGEARAFDAKGALSALDQISKLLGLDAPAGGPDAEDNRVTLTLADKVGDRGD